jgi:hypothetical protein
MMAIISTCSITAAVLLPVWHRLLVEKYEKLLVLVVWFLVHFEKQVN